MPRSTLVTYVLLAGSAAVLAGTAVYALGTNNQEYASSATLAVVPLSGTGDPDRVVATQIAVIQSRSLRGEVSQALGGRTDFSLGANQERLSNIVTVRASSRDPQVARDAATAATTIFAARVQDPVLADVATIDPAAAPSASGSAVSDAAVAATGGGVLATAGLLAFVTARPRVRRAYVDPPEDVPLLELPDPGSRRGQGASSAELTRLSQHLVPRPAATFAVSALPGVGASAASWVASVLHQQSGRDEQGGDEHSTGDGSDTPMTASAVPDTTDPEAQFAVVVARAWVDNERELRRLVAARRAFADVLIVVLGARQTSFVPPRPSFTREGQMNALEAVRRRARRSGAA